MVFGQSDLSDIERYRWGEKGQAAISQGSRDYTTDDADLPKRRFGVIQFWKGVILLTDLILVIVYLRIYSGFHDLRYTVMRNANAIRSE